MMTQKGINNYLSGLVGGLLTIIGGLIVYIYINDKADAELSRQSIEELQKQVQSNETDIIKKVYNIAFTSMNDIKDLSTQNTEIAGNYRTLAKQLENLIEANKSDRELFMRKFDNHESRIVELEKNDKLQDKNIGIIAKDKGIQLFSATW